MKKNYIAPAILVQPINMDNLLAGSFRDGTDVNNYKPANDNEEANQFSKKHYNIWGDDEE